MTEQPNNIGDAEQVKARKTKRELKRERELREFAKTMLENPAGRYLLYRIFQRTNFLESISSPDSHSMAIHSGRRDVGQWLFDEMMKSGPDQFHVLMREGLQRDKE